MVNALVDLIPILLSFLAGIVLGRLKILGKRHADLLLHAVVCIGLPALIVSTISTIHPDIELALLPLCAILTILVIWPVSYVTSNILDLSRPTQGVFIIGTMIMNMAFVYPFILAFWGHTGLAFFILLDFGNGLLVLTLVYALACRYGSGKPDAHRILISVVTFPPFLALIAAVLLNLAGIRLPDNLNASLQSVGIILVFLVPLALGIYLDISKVFSLAVFLAIAIRVGLGLMLGLLWVTLFQLEGIIRAVVIMGTAAPVGFNTLVYASRQGLDKEFAASIASISMLIALIYLPVIALLLK